MAKKEKICKTLRKIEKLEKSQIVSYQVMRTFGKMDIFGSQVSFGIDNDYVTLDEVRAALNELVDEFGGKVEWNEEG